MITRLFKLHFILCLVLTILIGFKDTSSGDSGWDLTGTVEWKTTIQAGGANSIAGVYNPETKSVEWKTTIQAGGANGIAGAFKPNNPDDYWNYLKSIGLY